MTPPDDGQDDGKRRVFRIIFAIFLSILLLVILFIALLLFFPREQIRKYIQNQLARRLDNQVEIYGLRIDYFSPAKLVMSQVVITDPETSLQEFRAREVVLHINPLNFFRDENPITRIELGSPLVNLRRTEGGAWNFEKMVEPQSQEEEPGAEVTLGPIFIRNGIIQIFERDRDMLLAIKGIVATVRLRRGQVLIDAASLYLPPLRADFVGTISNLQAPRPTIDLQVSGTALKEGPLSELGGVALEEKAQVAAFSAEGKGPLDNVRMTGTYAFDRSVTRGIPTEGTLAGVLEADAGTFRVDSVIVNFGNSRGSLSGTATNLWSDERSAEFSGETLIVPEPLFTALDESLAYRLEPDGVVEGEISVRATKQEVVFRTDLNLERAGFTIPNVLRKDIQAPGSLSTAGRYSFGQALSVDEFELTMGDSSVSGKGSLGSEKAPWAEATFEAADFPLRLLDRLPAVAFPEGEMTFDATISKEAQTVREVQYRGDVTLRNAELTAGPLKEPITGLNAQLRVADQEVGVQNAQFSFAQSPYNLDVELTDFSSPTIRGTLRTQRMDIEKIMAAIETEDTREGEPRAPLLQDIALNLVIEADSVYTRGIETGALSTTLTSPEESLVLDPFSVIIFSGELRGILEFTPSPQQVLWKANLEARDMKIAEMLDQFDVIAGQMTGSLDAKVTVQGVAGNNEQTLSSLKGDIEATARGGKVEQSPVLTTIINFTQIPLGTVLIPGLREIVVANTVINLFRTGGRSLDITSVAYTTIEGDFVLAEGTAQVDDFRFHGGIIDLIATGEIDYISKTVDLRVSATPLGALTSVMAEIPLIGGILKGAKEAVISTDFAVTGPISSPEVNPMFIGGGARDEAPPPAPEEEAEPETVPPAAEEAEIPPEDQLPAPEGIRLPEEAY
ncbi:MAG: AsmA family protein [Candidatus Abyssobacteria bacterium SURF_5]|uniref:AsmA family protein n=1 Tax=Abyssobacteria bacterium (strain SURF_5) TaxID=2093360 RepID=A0A3A4NCK7_ABYX5|nr:MAG: AsmA family protein [Candidatus Abyssubacteria bacterium SURF_5]